MSLEAGGGFSGRCRCFCCWSRGAVRGADTVVGPANKRSVRGGEKLSLAAVQLISAFTTDFSTQHVFISNVWMRRVHLSGHRDSFEG